MPKTKLPLTMTPEVVQAADGGAVVAIEVLIFALLAQVGRADGLEADEEAAQAAGGRLLEQAGLAAIPMFTVPAACQSAAHAASCRRTAARRSGGLPKQMIVEEVQMTAGQAVDLGERVVDGLRVERLAALEERVLVAEVADVRAAARDDDRVGHEVEVALDQIAADGRHADQRARSPTDSGGRGRPARKSRRNRGPGVLAGSEEDRVGVRRGLVGQRRDVQTAERDERAAARGNDRRSRRRGRRW